MKIIFSGASASNCDSGISDGSPGPQVENDCDDCEKQIYNCDDCDKQMISWHWYEEPHVMRTQVENNCDDCDKQVYRDTDVTNHIYW